MVDVVLLELEGVIFDTHEIREASLREAIAAHGLESLTGADEVLTDLIALRAARAFSARIATAACVPSSVWVGGMRMSTIATSG